LPRRKKTNEQSDITKYIKRTLLQKPSAKATDHIGPQPAMTCRPIAQIAGTEAVMRDLL
jgi:hypothetical protein